MNPLPQTITVTSTGPDFNFTAAIVSGTGGNWLAISGLDYSNTSGTTPRVVTVSVSPIVSLAAGIYAAQIVFTGTGVGAGKSLTIPVMLTVTAPVTPFFDNLPGQLGFSLKTGSTTIPSQKIQIRNAGSGTLPWNLVSTTSDGAPWLVASVTSGTAPTSVSISISLANLPGGGATPGTYIGQLRFRSTSAGNVTVPVSVLVGDSVFDQINPLSFTKIYGGINPLPQVLTVASTYSNFGFSASSSTAIGGTWLTYSGLDYSNTSGTTPRVVNVAITADVTLPVGSYTGQIVFKTTSAAITVPVTLTVAAASDSVFDNTAGQLSFPVQRTFGTVPNQTVDVRNAGQGSLSWTVTTMTADGGNWLHTNISSGVAPSGPITVSVSVPNLPYGGYVSGVFTGQLLFESAGNSITIPVSAIVDDNTLRPITPLSFTKVYQGADPLRQTLTIASTGTNFTFNAYVSTANGGNWLNYSGLTYSNSSGTTPQIMSVGISSDPNLAVGTYTGEIVMSTGMAALTVPVTLSVRPASAPQFDNLPGQLSFSFKTNSGNPPTKNLLIRNAGAGTLSWAASAVTSDGANWLHISSSSGTAPSTIMLSVTAADLPYGGLVAGTFTGMITLVSGNGSTSVPVSVIVGDSVFVQPAAIAFVKPVVGGANPTSQAITLSSTGSPFTFSAYATSAKGGNWLSFSGLTYSNTTGTTPQVITVSANPDAALPAGVYTAEIVASTGTMATTIPVTLTIGNASSPTATKIGTYFNGTWAIDANNNILWDGPPSDKYFPFSAGPGDIAVVGDWNGDGVAKAGLYRNGFWLLDYNGNGIYDAGDKFFAFGGNAGETPIVGDWNGDGKTKVGVYSHGYWTLDYNGNGQWDGAATDRYLGFGGNPGETPLVGDWNGDKKAKIGYFLNGNWVLDYNGNGQWDGPSIDRYYSYTSLSTDKPIIGDWNGDGTTKIGVYRNGFWVLDWNGNGVYDAGIDKFYGFGGNVGEVPVIGDWNGDGKSKVGYYLHGFWALDYNGNGQWDGVSVDRFGALGGNPGEQIVIGRW